MSEFTPAASWSAARKVAGASDSRQVRDVKSGNAITYSKMPFLAMFADKVPGEDGKLKDQAPTLPSRGVATLTPELNDDEVAPTTFRLTADTVATDVGSSVDLVLDDVSGLSTGMLLNNPGDGAMGRITAISGTTATIKVVYSPNGAVAWTAGPAGIKNLEKLQSANSDAPTVGVGTYREQINRSNGLQFSLLAMSQGILQEQLALHGNPGGEGANQDWKREQKLKMLDFQRQREQHLILSPTYYTEGSGDTRVIHSKGLVGWAGGVTPNPNGDGSVTFEDFVNVNLASAREGGGGSVVYGLCGLRVITALTGVFQKQIRITNVTEKYKAAFTEFETPAGILRLVRCDAMDTQAREGQMITFMEDYLERVFLRGLDLKYMEGLELNNILGKRAALMVCEATLVSNVKSLKLHTGLRKAA